MKMKLIVATITWIALISSMFSMPLVTLSSATYSSSVSTGINKTEDIFSGSFSPREVVAALDETSDAGVRVELNTEPQGATAPLEPGPSPPESFRTYGSYWNDETNALSGGGYMPVQIWDEDDAGSDDFLAEGWIGGSGYFDITAPNDEELLGRNADPHARFPAADTTPPTGSIVINSGATYTNSRWVTLTLSATDSESGVAYMRFADDYPTLTWSDWYPYATTFDFYIDNPGDGLKYVDVQFIDGAGHSTTPGTIYDGIYLDTTPPTGSIVINLGAIYTNSRWVTLTLSATDSGSGVASMRFADDYPTLTWSDWYPYAATFDFYIDSPGDGGKSVDVQFIDLAGNPTPPGAIYDGIYLDTTPPTGSITIGLGDPAYTTSTAVTLYLTYSDNLGVKEVYYANEGDPSWTGPFSPTATMAWTLSPGDGTKTVYYLIVDYAGNWNVDIDSIILDTVAPTVTSFTVTPNPFSPNGDGIEDTTTVAATFSETVNWEIQLKDSVGNVMLTWTGTGTSLNIVWDGKVGSTLVPDGVYEFILSGEDLAGWPFPTETEPVTVDTGMHDIAVVDVTPSRTIVGRGYPVLIDVTVENHGDATESFNLTVYYGNSAITAEQWETFWSLGDINRDGYINGTDVNLIKAAFFAEPGSYRWNPWADLNQDLIIDILDAGIVNAHYGLEIWTYAISGGFIQTLPVIDLAAGNTRKLTFTWDTSSSMPYGDYVICSYAVPILGRETDRADNSHQDGTVRVTIPGDVNGDKYVTSTDLSLLLEAYGKQRGQEGYTEEIDITGEGWITSTDLSILLENYGQNW